MRMRPAAATALALILAGAGGHAARAEPPLPHIWDVKLGTPVGDLPDEEFVDPACGTNGGPPGLRHRQLRGVRKVPRGILRAARDLVPL